MRAIHRVLAALPLAAAGLFCSCSDLPSGAAPPALAPGPSAGGALLAVHCSASPAAGRLSCDAPPAGAADILIGGQRLYVNVISENVAYDSVAQQFAFDVRVQNLIPQPIGTRDGVTADSAGIKLFFHTPPTPTGGSGGITIVNADGIGSFTASTQAFFRYDTLLPPGAITRAKRWIFAVPKTVTTFSFVLYLYAAVPLPDGWVEIGQGDTIRLAREAAIRLDAAVRYAVGAVRETGVTWSVSNPAIATVSGSLLTAGSTFGTTSLTARWGALSRTAVVVVGIPALTSVRAGYLHSCGLDAAGVAYCWGSGERGELGVPGVQGALRPVGVRQDSLRFAAIAPGLYRTCGLTTDGRVYCWGAALGLTYSGSASLVALPQGALRFTSLAAGVYHMCALTAAGEAYCWGSGSSGELGSGTTGSATLPTRVLQGGQAYVKITAGFRHACGLTAAGQAYCWGDDQAGELGDGNQTTVPVAAPVAVQQGGVAYVDVVAGRYHTCALATTGQAYCWGSNGAGQLGDGTNQEAHVPVAVQQWERPYAAIAIEHLSGSDRTCGLTPSGQTYCWGATVASGTTETPLGTYSTRVPVPVMQGGRGYAQVDVGGYHDCALDLAGAAWCWGQSYAGQLGNGLTYGGDTPVPVLR